MITCEWRDSWVDDPEVADMLTAAAAFDAEQGFSASPPPLDEFGSHDGRTGRELTAWISPEVGTAVARPRRLPVAFLRVTVDDAGTGSLELTVRHEYRSRGIGTLLVETLGWDTMTPGGWAGTGARRLRAWARGSHPAAERMAMRFGGQPERTLWRIIRPLSEGNPVPHPESSGEVLIQPIRSADDADASARLAAAAAVEFDHESPDVLVARDRADGVVGFVEFVAFPLDGTVDERVGAIRRVVVDPSADRARITRALLGRALQRLSEAGLSEVEMFVDPSEGLVSHCRAVGFHHDQTDVCYRIPSSSSETFTKLQA